MGRKDQQPGIGRPATWHRWCTHRIAERAWATPKRVCDGQHPRERAMGNTHVGNPTSLVRRHVLIYTNLTQPYMSVDWSIQRTRVGEHTSHKRPQSLAHDAQTKQISQITISNSSYRRCRRRVAKEQAKYGWLSRWRAPSPHRGRGCHVEEQGAAPFDLQLAGTYINNQLLESAWYRLPMSLNTSIGAHLPTYVGGETCMIMVQL